MILTRGHAETPAGCGESEMLEFKKTTGARREAVITVRAFLGRRSGQVLFGVTLGGAVVGGGGCAD